MTGILNALIAGVSGAVKDAYFNLVSLLLPGNGTNGAQNNTFLDSSANTFTITRNGNTTQGTFSPFSQTGWGNYFDGNGDYLSATANSAFDFGTGDFTIEAWVYTDGTTESFGKRVVNKFVSNGWLLEVLRTSGNTVRFLWVNSSNVTVADIGTNDAFTAFTWHHIAVSRSGANISLYVDGSRKATSSSVSGGTDNVSNNLLIGSANLADTHFDGYISNARLVKGTAVYDPTLTSITVPTAPLTAITNTSLLTCQSNRFRDASTNNFTITRNGDTSVTPFSPFAPTQSYSAAVGGSGYFDGTGDYLSVADNTALDMEASDFTMECWVYLNETPSSSDGIFAKRTDVGTFGGVLIYFSGLTPNFYATLSGSSWGIAFSSSIAATLNAWTHLAFTRSGSTWTIYVNGVSGGTGNSSGTVPNNTSAFVVGAYSSDGNATYLFPAGYISNVRVVKGTAIVPPAGGPTAPLTAVPNTSLLLNFTNAGITDATAKNVLETVGNAQISTSVSKFGGGSMYFDGTGDYLVAPNSPLLDQIGDFTHEMWYYRSGNGAAGQFDVCFYKDITNYLYMVVDRNNSYKACIVKHNIGFIITGTTALASATWYHLAFSRSGSTVRLFVNGVLDGSATESTNTSGSAVSYFGGSAGHTFNGYIDDMRITRGYARYTANFTPPTAPFPVQ